MSIIERLRGKFGNNSMPDGQVTSIDGALQGLVSQEYQEDSNPYDQFIEFGSHPDKYYPGFKDFCDAWNTHVLSDQRKKASGELYDAEKNAQRTPISPEEQLMSQFTLANETINQGTVAKDELKKLKRMRRRAREKLERGGSEVLDHQARINLLRKKLVVGDFQAVVGMGDYAPVFYAREFLQGDTDARDALFVLDAQTQQKTEFGIELHLSGLNYLYHFRNKTEEESSEEVSSKRDMDRDRQMQLVRKAKGI